MWTSAVHTAEHLFQRTGDVTQEQICHDDRRISKPADVLFKEPNLWNGLQNVKNGSPSIARIKLAKEIRRLYHLKPMKPLQKDHIQIIVPFEDTFYHMIRILKDVGLYGR